MNSEISGSALAVDSSAAVIGLGKVGLPVAVRLAESGMAVTGADVDEVLLERIRAGGHDFANEPGLSNRLRDVCSSGRLTVTSDVAAAARASDVAVVLVRLVTNENGEPNYASIDDATERIASGLRGGCMVIFETTVPVGDTRNRFGAALQERTGLIPGQDFCLCFSPERVSAGTVFKDLERYPKVVGGVTAECTERAAALYRAGLGADVISMGSPEAAELTKIAEALYRDANIAIANEVAMYADELGIAYGEIAAAANSQPFSHLHGPGLGVGGHCIPVYPKFFIGRAHHSALAATARAINDSMPAYAVGRLANVIGDLHDLRVLVLGLTFRGDVSEAGFSMAVPLVRKLRDEGAVVTVHDAVLGRDEVLARGYSWGQPGDTVDVVILQAAHREYASLGPPDLPGVRAVLDGRNVWSPEPWRDAGVTYLGIGR